MEDELVLRHVKYLTLSLSEQYSSRTWIERILQRKIMRIGDGVEFDWVPMPIRVHNGYIIKKTYSWTYVLRRSLSKRPRRGWLNVDILLSNGNVVQYKATKIKQNRLLKEGLYWSDTLNLWVI